MDIMVFPQVVRSLSIFFVEALCVQFSYSFAMINSKKFSWPNDPRDNRILEICLSGLHTSNGFMINI